MFLSILYDCCNNYFCCLIYREEGLREKFQGGSFGIEVHRNNHQQLANMLMLQSAYFNEIMMQLFKCYFIRIYWQVIFFLTYFSMYVSEN